MTRPQAAVLAAILVAAAILRAVGLDQGLRHPPHGDESAFVENVHRMIAEGDLDMNRIVGTLRRAGYDRDLCIEDESLGKFTGPERKEHIKSAIAVLRKAIG